MYFSRDYFRMHSRDLPVALAGAQVAAQPKEFATGSFGWHYQGKLTVMIGGVPVLVSANVLLTVVNSKSLK